MKLWSKISDATQMFNKVQPKFAAGLNKPGTKSIKSLFCDETKTKVYDFKANIYNGQNDHFLLLRFHVTVIFIVLLPRVSEPHNEKENWVCNFF